MCHSQELSWSNLGKTQKETAVTKLFVLKALWKYGQKSQSIQEGQTLTVPTLQAGTEGSHKQFHMAMTEAIKQGAVE